MSAEEIERVGRAFVDALAAQDLDGLRRTMADDVRFRMLLPNGPQEEVGAETTLAKYADWFGEADELHLETSSVEALAERLAAGFRFRLHDSDGWQVIEQHIVADVDAGGRLQTIDMLCTGFLMLPDPASGTVHQFDAGKLGCADGLAGEFRRRIGQIPVGDVLVVTARDPAAKEDLPPLARMMGHTIRSIETPGDGRLMISVERGR